MTHHRTYKLTRWSGEVLRTRISRPVDRSEYRKSTWAHILRDQLVVTENEFWACVRDRALPDRGAPPAERPGLPYSLLNQLVNVVGLPSHEAAGYSTAEATDRIALHWRDLAAKDSEAPPG